MTLKSAVPESTKITRDKVFKLANEALNPSLKDLARQRLISFTEHKRSISSEGLEVLYAANQLGRNPPESFANSAWFNTILYFGKKGRENQREISETRCSSAHQQQAG